MITTLNTEDLRTYVTNQLNFFFPDKKPVSDELSGKLIQNALDRLEFCFRKVTLTYYFDGEHVKFNHLFSDHYMMFVWYLSNSVYREYGKCDLANKLYYLNKALHGLDCMADRSLPDVFLIFHGVGTMLGKAEYNDFFVVLNGCTVGSQKGIYPTFGKGVALTANSSAIGDCKLGNRSTVSTRTTVFKKTIEADHTAFMDFDSGTLQIKKSHECYAQQFFNVDLKQL